MAEVRSVLLNEICLQTGQRLYAPQVRGAGKGRRGRGTIDFFFFFFTNLLLIMIFSPSFFSYIKVSIHLPGFEGQIDVYKKEKTPIIMFPELQADALNGEVTVVMKVDINRFFEIQKYAI